MKKSLILTAFALSLFVFPGAASAHDEERKMCTMQYNPVCGIKAGVYVTYGNSCMLGVEGAAFVHEGECTDKEEISNGPEKPTEPEKPYVPPASCIAWFDGCNSCSKDANGNTACTLRACIGEPAAGYCTRDEGDTKPAPTPAPSTSGSASITSAAPNVSVEVEASTTASVGPTEMRTNFFTRIWANVSGFLLNLF